MTRRLVLAFVFFWSLQPVQAADYPKSPKDVMAAFLEEDAQAAALSPQTWQELGRYTTWVQPPSVDSMVVIDSYSIGRVTTGSTRALIVVTYKPLGTLSDKFVPDPAAEVVTFHLNKVKGQWKVDSPQILPHVSHDVMKKRLQTASAANPKIKAANDAILAQLESVRH